MVDGDTFFCLASGRRPLDPDSFTINGGDGLRPDVLALDALLAAAADAVTAACLDAVLRAEGRGPWRSYRELAGVR